MKEIPEPRVIDMEKMSVHQMLEMFRRGEHLVKNSDAYFLKIFVQSALAHGADNYRITDEWRHQRNKKDESPLSYRGYHPDDLKAAFDKVKNKKDWQLPINAVVSRDEIGITDAAIKYYFGADASFSMLKNKEGYFRVLSDGYQKNLDIENSI